MLLWCFRNRFCSNVSNRNPIGHHRCRWDKSPNRIGCRTSRSTTHDDLSWPIGCVSPVIFPSPVFSTDMTSRHRSSIATCVLMRMKFVISVGTAKFNQFGKGNVLAELRYSGQSHNKEPLKIHRVSGGYSRGERKLVCQSIISIENGTEKQIRMVVGSIKTVAD